MMKKETRELLEKLRPIKNRLQREGFVIDALFGSYARGDFGPHSDVDLLYHVEGAFLQKHRGFRALLRLNEIKALLAEELGASVDLAPTNNLSKTGRRFILSEAIDV